ncbi:uncharacterized protein LOC128715075 [Anopheles marshallii]|uniref:uncharacterized protein LOC128715075 n=1 Tax=Anopheles marshallii TaxID=1521116 RepID=UPI00237A5977|nr:uncharacterized protein LOC128715075 [Anopheles marshallii]
MPIVKEKTIQNDLQNAFEINLRRKSSRAFSTHLVKDIISLHEHLTKNESTEQKQQTATIESVASSEHNLEQQEDAQSRHARVAEFQLQIRSLVSGIVAMRATKINANDDRITQVGLSFFEADRGAMNVGKLVQLMASARKTLSDERKKLLLAMRRFKRYQTQNFQLDNQMQDVSLEQYYELKAEVNRIGEKLEETNKRMNNSRQLFENDVARATHVREKLFDSQNQIVAIRQQVSEVQQDYYSFKSVLCEQLQRKKQLRKKNERLKLKIQLIKLMPWYSQTNQQIELTKSFIEKFN